METMVVAVFCCRNESLHMRFLSVGGGMGIMSVFFGENENKLVLSCELRSGPVWVIFFPSFQAPCIHTYAITTNWLNRCQHVKIWECNVMKTGIFRQVAKQ
jgi:hypothetical protein